MFMKQKACYIIMGFFYFFSQVTIAQDQRIADSLSIIYQADTSKRKVKLELLRNLAFNEFDSELSLQYAEELIKLASEENNNEYLFHGYYQKGNTKKVLGDIEEAANAFFKSAEVAKKENNTSREGSAYGAIADIYAISANYENAMLYYDKAINTLRNSTDKIALASFILNAGDALLNNKKYDTALIYFQESGEIFEEVNYPVGKLTTWVISEWFMPI